MAAIPSRELPRKPGTGHHGEQTAKLDAMLGRPAERVETEARTSRTLGIVILSTLAFLCAAGFVAYKVISFYAGMFSQLGKDF